MATNNGTLGAEDLPPLTSVVSSNPLSSSKSGLKILQHTLYHPTNGAVDNVQSSGKNYSGLDVRVSKMFYQKILVTGISPIGRYLVPPENTSSFPVPAAVPGYPPPPSSGAVNMAAAYAQYSNTTYENWAVAYLHHRLYYLDLIRGSGNQLVYRRDDHPPVAGVNPNYAQYNGYILTDVELINYPYNQYFQTPLEASRVAAMKLNCRILYKAIKLIYPNAKVGHWGLGGADAEPFNTTSIRWNDFVNNNAFGAGYFDDAGVSLTISGVTGWVNYVAKKMEDIFADSCDFFAPNFYSSYRGGETENPATTDIHYRHISSWWGKNGTHVVKSRSKTYADITMKVLNKTNQLLIASGKPRKEIFPSIWNFCNSSQQFGVNKPGDLSALSGCNATLMPQDDRSDSSYSLRKFMEQRLGESQGSPVAYNFKNLEKFTISAPCDATQQVIRHHPTMVDQDKDYIYENYIKTALQQGADGFHNWCATPVHYDVSYAVQDQSQTATFFNLGNDMGVNNNHLIDIIYTRRYALEAMAGLCMAGIPFSAYNGAPNSFPNAAAKGFNYTSWGDVALRRQLCHKYTDHVLRYFVQHYAFRAKNDGLLG